MVPAVRDEDFQEAFLFMHMDCSSSTDMRTSKNKMIDWDRAVDDVNNIIYELLYIYAHGKSTLA